MKAPVFALLLLPTLALAQAQNNASGGISANCPSCTLIDSTLTLQSTGSTLVLPTNGKVCLNGSTCTYAIYFDTANMQISANGANGTAVVGGPMAVGEGLTIGNNKGAQANTIAAAASAGGTWTSNAPDGSSAVGFTLNNGITLSTAGAKLLSVKNNTSEKLSADLNGNVLAAGNPVPEVHSTQTTSPVAVEFFTQALTAGAATKTFATAFSSAPVCACGDTTAAAAVKWVPTATNVALTGTSTDSVQCICIGAK